MALGAVLAAALTDHAARAKALWIDNVDYLLQPGTAGNGYGIPLDTVHMTEAGPGGVSEIEFVLEDPQLAVTLTEGSFIRFHDILRDSPLFSGYIQSVKRRPAFGDQGRVFEVKGVGVEILLDWCVTTVDIAFGDDFAYSDYNRYFDIRSIINATVGFNAVNTLTSYGLVTPTGSNQAWPISGTLGPRTTFYRSAVTIPAGTSIREALRILSAHWATVYSYGGESSVLSIPPYLVTIDFWLGLRIWDADDRPEDYTDLTIVDTSVGAIVAEDLTHETDAAGVVHGVFVKGGNPAGTGYVTDGSGLPGPIARLDDPTITNATQRDNAAYYYLYDFHIGVRGTFKLTDRTPVPTIHPGINVVITDARIPLTSWTYRIMQIEKAFHPTRDDWTVAYGGNRPSAMDLTRRLTRSTLS